MPHIGFKGSYGNPNPANPTQYKISKFKKTYEKKENDVRVLNLSKL